MSALNSLLRDEIEAQGTLVWVKQLVQRCIGRWSFGGLANLQHMLSRVFRVELEGVHGPFLNGSHPSARNKLALFRFIEEMNRGLDTLAAADVNTATMLQAADRMMMLADLMMFGLIDENESLGVDLDAKRSKDSIEFA
jgi:hypothetical protein